MFFRKTLLLLGAIAAVKTLPAQSDQVRAMRNVMVAARDGVKLGTNIFLPGQGNAPGQRFPAIVERTPYNKDSAAGSLIEYYVTHGYAVVIQDVRGRYLSEGRWSGSRDDGADGSDLLKWIGEQPWSNGKIGTMGTSYGGATQHALAIANAPNLTAMVPVDAMSNPGRYGIRHDGAFELRWLNWILTLGNATGVHATANGTDVTPNGHAAAVRAAAVPEAVGAIEQIGPHIRDYAAMLPLRPGTTPLQFAPEYEAWLIQAMRHGDNDSFWKDSGISVVDHLAEYKDIPVCHLTGWYDSWSGPVANLNYAELAKAKKSPQRLVIGPWTHMGQAFSFSGIAEFGPEAAIDLNALRLRWYDRWLKGVDNGIEKEPPVRIFVMGAGEPHKTPEGRLYVGGHWRDEREWPPARAVSTPYYIHPDGSLSTVAPAASEPTSYRFDPADPVPTLGGNVSSEGALMSRGAQDQRCLSLDWPCKAILPLSARSDVLVYRTSPLAQDVEVTGRLIVKLWASSDGPDTDFTAKLVDVYPPNRDYPAGIDLNVGDGIVRARYRDSLEHAKPLVPGQPVELTIEMYPTSLVFRRGHRIRLDISSSNFPRFDVNPNTGGPLGQERGRRVALNSVYHDPAHASRILLPVIPQ
ncbi:MAG TPA: CocE/NonD family hydrolase [Bryobacteraceae bacterium]|nr:CocE/NonD family hydrolase [Bryobacteraceae bacterium]